MAVLTLRSIRHAFSKSIRSQPVSHDETQKALHGYVYGPLSAAMFSSIFQPHSGPSFDLAVVPPQADPHLRMSKLANHFQTVIFLLKMHAKNEFLA